MIYLGWLLSLAVTGAITFVAGVLMADRVMSTDANFTRKMLTRAERHEEYQKALELDTDLVA